MSRDPLFYGMATVMAGGLLVGTVLTLGVVPVAYSLLYREPVGAPEPRRIDTARTPGTAGTARA